MSMVDKKEAATKSKVVLIVSMIIAIVFVALGAIFPDGTARVINILNSFLTGELGWMYLLFMAFFVFFTFGLAFSKYGKIKLGKDDDKPEFSNFQWFALLFGGGIGIGLVFWAIAEPMQHLATGPQDPALTVEAMRTAVRITFAHEGVHCWATFALVGTCLAYHVYRKDRPFLMSSAFYPLFGDRIYGPIGYVVDILATFATLFGIVTSLGLAAMQIVGGLSYMYGFDTSNVTVAIVIVVITLGFTLATATGLHAWMTKVVNLKTWLAILFMLFFLVFGGFVFIMRNMSDAIGVYLNDFFTQTFWYGDPEWLSSWTVFYWAWWISWATFCGTFFARVSKGRSVRQMLLGSTFLPAGFSFIWIAIYASAAFNLDLTFLEDGSVLTGPIFEAANADYATAMYATLEQLPLYQIMGPLALILVFLCFLGAADSATFVLPMLTMGGSQNPPKKARIFWGAAQGAVAIVLVLAAGEATLKALQTASVMAAFPFMFILALMCIGIVRAFKGEFNPSIGDTPMFDKEARQAAKARKAEQKAAAQKAAEEEAAAEQ